MRFSLPNYLHNVVSFPQELFFSLSCEQVQKQYPLVWVLNHEIDDHLVNLAKQLHCWDFQPKTCRSVLKTSHLIYFRLLEMRPDQSASFDEKDAVTTAGLSWDKRKLVHNGRSWRCRHDCFGNRIFIRTGKYFPIRSMSFFQRLDKPTPVAL